MNPIFKSYSGNDILTSALMTVEALAELDSVRDIKPSTLLAIYEKYNIPSILPRMKSYTMVFGKNNPLKNTMMKNGVAIYDECMRDIFANFENEGSRICQVSGLRFNKRFGEFYKDATRDLNPRLWGTGTFTMNRYWFPLAGSLESDAQSLPQAKFEIDIHPIVIAIVQFLPLSASLSFGLVNILNTTAFAFSRKITFQRTKMVLENIRATPRDQPIENIRIKQPEFILEMIKYFSQEDVFITDVSLFNFTNSKSARSEYYRGFNSRSIAKIVELYKNDRDTIEAILEYEDRTNYFFKVFNEDPFRFEDLYPNAFLEKKILKAEPSDFYGKKKRMERKYKGTKNNQA